MITRRPGHPARQPYKVTVSLFPAEWDALRMEAQARAITGGELVAAILSEWIYAEQPVEDVPIPDVVSEDA